MAHEKLVVAKVGSSTLVDSTGKPDIAYIRELCRQIANLHDAGTHVVLVSSGAAAAGRERLGFSEKPQDTATLQACAAAGQAALIELYAKILAERGIACGQVLLTRRDVIDREGYLNARNTFERLLDLGCIPVVNENDTVAVPTQTNFGGNDLLGAIVSALISADLYVILSDVDGLYDKNPQEFKDAQRLRLVTKIDAKIMRMAGGSGSSFGTGGMAAKLLAARAMLAAGVPTVVAQGRADCVLERIVAGDEVGTRFESTAQNRSESSLKLWIGMVEVAQGSITIDKGAEAAILDNGASILPVGIVKCQGDFSVGDVIDVLSKDGQLLGRGVARYSSDMMRRVRGLKLDVVARFLDKREVQPAIHRDELLVF